MIALPDEVICPACGGQPEPGEICWPCRNRGMVEAWRVCPNCGRFNDFCICHSKLEQETVTLPEKSGMKGVYLNAAHNSYIVSVSRGGRAVFLGEFPAEMLDLAKACRSEADAVAADDLPALRVKYGKLRAERGGRNFVNRGKKNGREPDPSLADLAADQSPNDLTEPNPPPPIWKPRRKCVKGLRLRRFRHPAWPISSPRPGPLMRKCTSGKLRPQRRGSERRKHENRRSRPGKPWWPSCSGWVRTKAAPCG